MEGTAERSGCHFPGRVSNRLGRIISTARNHKDENVSYVHMYAATARRPVVHGTPRLHCVTNPTCVVRV